MIQLRIKSCHEDRFGVALRDYLTRQKYIEFKNIEVDQPYIDFIIDCHPKFINSLFMFFRDLNEIFDIPFVFRFVYTEKEAYTGTDKISKYCISWLTFEGNVGIWSK